jgi:hypothetical protein
VVEAPAGDVAPVEVEHDGGAVPDGVVAAADAAVASVDVGVGEQEGDGEVDGAGDDDPDEELDDGAGDDDADDPPDDDDDDLPGGGAMELDPVEWPPGVDLGGCGGTDAPRGLPGSTGGSGGRWAGRPCLCSPEVGSTGTVTPTPLA